MASGSKRMGDDSGTMISFWAEQRRFPERKEQAAMVTIQKRGPIAKTVGTQLQKIRDFLHDDPNASITPPFLE